MDGYYAYLLDNDGRIKARINLELESEDEAIEQAKSLVDGHDVELWQLDRKIAIFKHER